MFRQTLGQSEKGIPASHKSRFWIGYLMGILVAVIARMVVDVFFR